jgi:alpha-beta hydrolase superfamily lysophospholipase
VTKHRPIEHRWFASGDYSLLGHVHRPEGAVARLGVVIVPPFGWEDVCCYRPLRELAEMLAAQGIAVLRYDLPGTGDSTGGANDQGLVWR